MNLEIVTTGWRIPLAGFMILIAVLIILKFLVSGMRTLFSKHDRRDAGIVRKGGRIVFGGIFPLLFVGFALIGLAGGKVPRSVSIAFPAGLIHDENSEHDTVQKLSEARLRALEKSQTAAVRIPINISTIAMPTVSFLQADTQLTSEAPAAADSTSDLAVADETIKAADGPTTPEPESDVAGNPETPQERQQKLAEVAFQIGPWIRSLLDKEQQIETTVDGNPAQAAESTDKQIVVFQLPGSMHPTYALIRLTPAVDAAISPMKPLLADGRLEAMANSLARFLDKTANDKPADLVTVQEEPADESATVLAGPPGTQNFPTWYRNPDGGRVVATTEPLFGDDDDRKPVVAAINKALRDHILVFAETLNPVLRNQARRVQFELDEATAKGCIVDSFEREEWLTSETMGPQNVRFINALVEFPEAIDKIALQKVKQSLQQDRVAGLGVIVTLAWLSVCSAALSVRLWGKGSWIRRSIAVSVLGVLTCPLLLSAAGIGIRLQNAEMPDFPWADDVETINIEMAQKA